MRRVALVVLLLVVIVLAWVLWPQGERELRASLVAQAAPADLAGFERAVPGQTLQFPQDHGPHDDYQTEWWYYTGNLTGENGEHFGYQLTFFRRALLPPEERASRTSDWAADQVYMAHFALTDVAGGHHHSFEKLARGAAGVAGAQAQPFRVWLEDWSVTGKTSAPHDGPYRKAPETLHATAGDIAIDLALADLKGPVSQGDRGYSQKGPETGNASYYYSLPRIATSGRVTVAGRSLQVEGLSWMDHEYSTSALGRDQVGWDWFSIQLSNNTELMVFQLRRTDGSIDEFSSGTLIAADGTTRRLGPGDFALEPVAQWRSPRTGADYPSGWRLRVPAADISLEITPHLDDQEMDVSYLYWEGAVKVIGTVQGESLAGNGYVELTGYAASMQGEF